MTTIWLNGALMAEEDGSVPIDDHGLVVGDGVFETMRVVRGQPFAARRHLERLRHSAAGLGIATGWTDDQLRAGMAALITANDPSLHRLRLTITGGSNPQGSMREPGARPTAIMVLSQQAPNAATADVVTVPWTRNPASAVSGLKTTSYAENVVALARAKASGADDAIFADTAGNLSEGTGSNVFIVRDGELFTPSLDTGCLAGVTRAVVIELTGATETQMPLVALTEADEAFLTSSMRDVQPIASVDGRSLPEAPGPITRDAVARFADLLADDLDP